MQKLSVEVLLPDFAHSKVDERGQRVERDSAKDERKLAMTHVSLADHQRQLQQLQSALEDEHRRVLEQLKCEHTDTLANHSIEYRDAVQVLGTTFSSAIATLQSQMLRDIARKLMPILVKLTKEQAIRQLKPLLMKIMSSESLVRPQIHGPADLLEILSEKEIMSGCDFSIDREAREVTVNVGDTHYKTAISEWMSELERAVA